MTRAVPKARKRLKSRLNRGLRRLGYEVRRVAGSADHQTSGELDRTPITHNTANASSSRFSSRKFIDEVYLKPTRIEFYSAVMEHVPTDVDVRTVLDAGSGPAYVLKLVADAYQHLHPTLHAVDHAESLRQYVEHEVPGVVFETWPLERMGYDTGYFDLVFCNQVLEHILDPSAVLSELHRVCKPNGAMILTVPDGRTDTSKAHINFWSPESWREFVMRESRRLPAEVGHIGMMPVASTSTVPSGNNIAVLRS